MDQKYFYAVNNRTITKHDRATGRPLLQFARASGGPFQHTDSGVVVGSKLYAVHSNYPDSPMESSIEVFDTKTMRHVDTYSFRIYRGSLTWLDRHDGEQLRWIVGAGRPALADRSRPRGGLHDEPAKGWQVLGPGHFQQ